jgi:hypothetical protein
MGHYEDRDGEFVYIPFDDVQGETKMKADRSILFKMLGGKYHDKTLRMFPPYDVMWFPCGTTYELTPPLNMKKSKKWRMVHNPTLLYGIPVASESESEQS